MLLLGMMIGVTGGVGIGAVLMCCLIAAKRADLWMEDHMQEAFLKERNGRQSIRFLNAEGTEMFRIFDGETIRLTSGDGTNHVSVCTYVDQEHIEVDGVRWEILAFARRMQEIGISYTPFP